MSDKEKLDRKDPRFKKISITVDAYLPQIIDEDGFRQGLMTFQAFVTDVYNVVDGEREEAIGSIGGGLGSVTLSRKGSNDVSWQIHHDDLWNAFIEALEEEND
jgi:hypothetical protein